MKLYAKIIPAAAFLVVLMLVALTCQTPPVQSNPPDWETTKLTNLRITGGLIVDGDTTLTGQVLNESVSGLTISTGNLNVVAGNMQTAGASRLSNAGDLTCNSIMNTGASTLQAVTIGRGISQSYSLGLYHNELDITTVSQSLDVSDLGAGNGVRVGFKALNDNAIPLWFPTAWIKAITDDNTSTSYDSTLDFYVQTAGTGNPTSELKLSGAKLYPTTTTGLDLGGSSNYWGTAYVTAVESTGNVNGKPELRVLNFNYYDVDVAASQTTAEWGTDASAGVGGANFKQIPVPIAGSIIGIAVYSNTACTSGTLTADATINGTATGLQAGLNSADDTQTSYSTQAIDADAVTAGQRVGVKVTTDAEWAPTTADVVVTVTMEY